MIAAGYAITQIMAQKEAALRGWLAYVVLCTGEGEPQPVLHARFGEWINRAPELVQREDKSWELRA